MLILFRKKKHQHKMMILGKPSWICYIFKSMYIYVL